MQKLKALANELQRLAVMFAAAIILVSLLCWPFLKSSIDHDKANEQIMQDYNTAVAENLQYDNIRDIKSLAPYTGLTGEDWAWCWEFADKYNLAKLPVTENDGFSGAMSEDDSLRMLKNLKAFDVYVAENKIDTTVARAMLILMGAEIEVNSMNEDPANGA